MNKHRVIPSPARLLTDEEFLWLRCNEPLDAEKCVDGQWYAWHNGKWRPMEKRTPKGSVVRRSGR